MIRHQNLNELSDKDTAGMFARFTKERALTISVVIGTDGEVIVLSPFPPNWTQHNLLSVGMGIYTGEMMN